MPTEANLLRRLESEYVVVFQSMFGQPKNEAQSSAREWIKKAKEASLRNERADFDANTLFRLSETDATIRAEVAWKRQEGVRDEDFRWWWDMCDVERQLLVLMDFTMASGYFVALRRNGMSTEEAAMDIRHVYASYVYFADTNDSPKDENSPLPVELRKRVKHRIEQEMLKDASGAKWNAFYSQFPSFNACVRHEIASGRI